MDHLSLASMITVVGILAVTAVVAICLLTQRLEKKLDQILSRLQSQPTPQQDLYNSTPPNQEEHQHPAVPAEESTESARPA